MTIDEFLNAIKGYYYPYPEQVEKEVRKYLERKWIYKSELPLLYAYTLKYFSRSFKVAPDIAIFEEVNKKYGIIKRLEDGTRVIPDCEKLPQIEDLETREDFSAEIHKIIEPFRKNWGRI